jgi:histidinol-phosphate aminotransferase
MGHLTRRQILLGGGAIVGAGLAPVIPATSGSSALNLVSTALGADLPSPDQPIRLSANENPYGPSRVALKAIAKNMHLTNRYADEPATAELTDIVAGINKVPTDHMMVTTGSTEVLSVAEC